MAASLEEVRQQNAGALSRMAPPPAPALMAQMETSAAAVAAQAKAMVEARYTLAMYKPRSWDQVRQDILHECRRPSFAHNKSAYYKKPIGSGVEGLGIRFVEVALRCMTNVLVETTMIFEDDIKEVHRVSVTDLEANLTYPLDVRVSKTVERAKPLDDGSYISMRLNSYKKPVYTVPANDDDLLNKRGAQISKAIRTLGLRIIPGDIQDEAEDIIKAVRLNEAAKDPDAERKRIIDAFAEISVKATDLESYLGHDIGTCSPAELVGLRGIYGAIRDGEATWKAVMENKAEQGAKEPKRDDRTSATQTRPTQVHKDELRREAPSQEQPTRGQTQERTTRTPPQEPTTRVQTQEPPTQAPALEQPSDNGQGDGQALLFQDQADAGPTLMDALDAIRDGEFDLARDLARTLAEQERTIVENTIASRTKQQAEAPIAEEPKAEAPQSGTSTTQMHGTRSPRARVNME